MPRSSRRPVLAGLIAVVVLIAGCGGGDDGGDGAAGAVSVESSNDACTPAPSSVSAGSVKFTVKNTGGAATELYVYEGDKILSEVENIGPGTSRDLTVTLKAGGEYNLVCKPGQKGDGIKVPITVNP